MFGINPLGGNTPITILPQASLSLEWGISGMTMFQAGYYFDLFRPDAK